MVEELLALRETEGSEAELVPPVPWVVEELLPLREIDGGGLEIVSVVPSLMEELLWLLDEGRDMVDLSLGTVFVDETVLSEGVVEIEVEIEVEVETCCESISLSLIE